jgi:hypothetical protein
MKTRSIAIVTALLAMVIGVQASVVFKGSENNTATNKTYIIADVTGVNPAVTGTAGLATGTFSGGSGALSINVDALAFYTNSVAMTYTNDFATYLAGLSNVNVDSQVTYWGVDSTSVQIDSNIDRISFNEALVITFDTSGLTGDLEIQDLALNNSGTTEVMDFILYNPTANTIEKALWSKSQAGTDPVISFAGVISDGCQLICAAQPSATVRVKWLTLDITVPSSSTNIPPTIFSTVVSNSLVVLNWLDDPSPAVLDHYNLYRSPTTNEVDFAVISNPTNSAYIDSDVTNNVTYYYKATAVSMGGVETVFGNMVSATPFVTVPTGFIAEPGDQKVILSWDGSATNDLKFGTFSVYRSYNSVNFTDVIASNITEITYTDTNVVNEVLYYYAVSLVDYDGDESALSVIKGAVPSKALVVVNMVNNQQGDVRAFPTGTNEFFNNFGQTTLLGQDRMGAYYFAAPSQSALSRPTLGFKLQRSDLGNQSTNDIEYAKFRFWMYSNNLLKNGPHSSVEVYHSQTRPNNVGISTADWNNLGNDGWTLIGTVEGLTNGAPEGWYEIDVTDQVLADLSLDIQDANAGSSFQVRANDDLSFTTNDFVINTTYVTNVETSVITTNVAGQSTGAKLNDNLASGSGGSPLGPAFVPQIRIKFSDNRSGYLQWTDNYLPTVIGEGSVDYDLDGLDNLYEYGLNGNPTDKQNQGTLPEFTNTGGGFAYIHPKRSGDTNVVYTVETTGNLIYTPWTATGYTVGGTGVSGGTLDFVTNMIDMAESQKFIRLRIDYNQ